MSKTLKDLNIKNEITVFNRKYSIQMVEKPTLIDLSKDEEITCAATIDYDTQQIEISSNINPEAQLIALFHEIAHIAFNQVVVKNKITLENACDAVANLMYDFCHNFKVVKE